MYKIIGKQSRKPSGFFGKIVTRFMEKQNHEFYEKIINELEFKNGNKIFEIGYGTGYGINIIANRYSDCFISGIDFSDLMYSTAKKRNQKYIDQGIVKLSHGDLLTVEPNNDKYDKIFCINVIYFWDDLNQAFNRIYKMLSDDGVYCIYMKHEQELDGLKFAKYFSKYTIENVEVELKNVGFKNIEYKMDNGYYIKAKK